MAKQKPLQNYCLLFASDDSTVDWVFLVSTLHLSHRSSTTHRKLGTDFVTDFFISFLLVWIDAFGQGSQLVQVNALDSEQTLASALSVESFLQIVSQCMQPAQLGPFTQKSSTSTPQHRVVIFLSSRTRRQTLATRSWQPQCAQQWSPARLTEA